ncbi:MAG: hypothetical protein J6562_03440 [Candidatus Schmidhempelia sp.]|nr:hypothetical protein [Candidatus Schmidhempelia sp.]
MKFKMDLYFKNDQEIESFKTELLNLNNKNLESYFLKSKAKHDSLKISLMNLSDDVSTRYNQMRTIISVDDSKKYFQNFEQYKLYLYLENWFDKQLKKYYFTQNNLFEFINWVDKLLSKVPVTKNIEDIKNGYVSQWSHLYAFLNSLTVKQRREIIDQFELFYVNNNNSSVLKASSSIALDTIEKVEFMIAHGKLDFYSPSTREEQIATNSFASYYHKRTVLDDQSQKIAIKSSTLTLSRWLVNLVYEKMILMNFTILEKYFMNFCLVKRHEKMFPDFDFFCKNVEKIK